MNANRTNPATTLTACTTHTWISPSGGNITVNMLGPGNILDAVGTPISLLTYDDNTTGLAFCTDIHNGNFSPQRYCSDPNSPLDWRVAWVVVNYPPSTTDRVQQAARQAAVWTLTDNFVLDAADATAENGTTDSAVLSAYQAILGAIPTVEPPNLSTTNLTLTVSPSSSTLYLPGQTSIAMSAQLTQGGVPLANTVVNLAIADGGNGTVLSYPNNVTDGTGTVHFTLTNNSGSLYAATITATTQVTVVTGVNYFATDTSQTFQRLSSGIPQTVNVQGQSSVTWAAPSQLISVHKYEDLNYNQIQDAGEPNLPNWSFQLTLPDSTSLTATTNANGDAYFYNASQFGTYTVTETLQAGWVNSTPLSVTRSRSAADAWTQWAVTFGNTRTNILRVLKFHDLNQNLILDSGEPVLSGWQFTLEILNGATWTQINSGTTGTDGYLTFTGLAAGTYRVTETLQPGWGNTTPLVQTVVIPTGSPTVVFPVEFGNVQLGNLIIHKVVNWSGITPITRVFTICVTGPSYPTGTEAGACQNAGTNGGDLTWNNLIPGNYAISETGVGTEWTITYSSPNVTVPNNGGTVDATVTNTRKLGSLTVTKIVDWNGFDPIDQTFEICITGPSYSTPNCKTFAYTGTAQIAQIPQTWTNLIPGSYEVVETDPGNDWAIPIIVTSPVNVPIDGTTAVVTVTNTRTTSTPVTLMYFKVGSVNRNKVTLIWETAAEINNFGFNIYRSNQKDFATATLIAMVPTQSNGTSGAKYSYTDQMPGSGRWYYWLVDIDTSGSLNPQTVKSLPPVDAGPQDKFIYIPGVIR